MKEILQTRLLEFEKSAFLIDLVKHDSGKLYIEIGNATDKSKNKFNI